MLRACLLASVAALAMGASPAPALNAVPVSDIDSNGDGNLTADEMRAAGMNPVLAMTANINGDGVLSRSERELYNKFLTLVTVLADPEKRAEIAAHFEARKRYNVDSSAVADILVQTHLQMEKYKELSKKPTTWKLFGAWDSANGRWRRSIHKFTETALKLVDTFETETAEEKRMLALVEERRQQKSDDKPSKVIASVPAPTGDDDTPPTPGEGDTFEPVPEPENPFGPGGGPEDEFGPGGEFGEVE